MGIRKCIRRLVRNFTTGVQSGCISNWPDAVIDLMLSRSYVPHCYFLAVQHKGYFKHSLFTYPLGFILNIIFWIRKPLGNSGRHCGGGGGVGRSAIALNIGYNQDILCEHCFSIETIGPPNIWLNFRQYCLQRRYDYLEKEPYRALAIEGSWNHGHNMIWFKNQ